MNRDSPTWDYVLVSDLHLSLGYSQDRRAYHPREDFFFDEAFFRWIRWLDTQRAPDRRWEMVFVGDAFDFLPADQRTVGEYLRERARRQQTIDPNDGAQAVRYWERQFTDLVTTGRIPARIQRLLFEDDVIDGRVRLEVAPSDIPRSATPHAVRVPPWAVEIFSRYNPTVLASLEIEGVEWRLGQLVSPAGEKPGVAKERGLAGGGSVPVRLATPGAREEHESFERRYGFLPTPEKSAQKLDAIYRGHPVFFRALAWFVGVGHRVVFVRGNHDLELFWPPVQERIRECVAREYAAAFHGPDSYSPENRSLPDLEDRIRFEPGWFCYRRGAFYAEHGCQYDLISASANPARPILPGHPWVMNPDVGSLAVICLHNHLESQFPELENEANYGASLLDVIRRDPVRTGIMLIRHAGDFVRMAQRLWLAGHAAVSEQVPSQDDLACCAGPAGLTPRLVRDIYELGARPLLLRQRLAWLLFSPPGHAVKLALVIAATALILALVALYYLVITPAIASLLPASVVVTGAGPTLRLLGKALLWLLPPAAYAALRRTLGGRVVDDPLFEASTQIHGILRERDPELSYLIMGHNHRTNARPIALRADGRHTYYLNTGTWTPSFAEGLRRLQTLGREVEFTFLRLAKGIRGYEAQLLRWNDNASRADAQTVPPDTP